MDSATSSRRRRVVIVGGGFAGAYCAQALERRLPPDTDLVLLDRNNYFIFYPLLVEAGTGSVHPRDAVVGIRAFLRRGRFVMGDVRKIDLVARQVQYTLPECDDPLVLPYDHVVLATGSVTRKPKVPGLEQFGWDMKSIGDAVALRDRAIQLLESADATEDAALRAALLHFVVVGANFTGVEVAGEFSAFLREASRRYRNLRPEQCRLTLVELTDRILVAVDDPDLSEYATRGLRRRGIDVRLKTSVTEIRRREVVLDSGEILPSATVIWTAGIAPSPLLDKTDVPRDRHGYVLCRPDLRVEGFANVWAIGDSADIRDVHGKHYAATAQNAVREGRHLAENLFRALADRPTLPFEYHSRGALAALGCRTAVAKLFGVKLSGFPAWFLWRTVYLFKMPGWSRRVRIALDWSIQLLFRRDFVQLGVHRERPPGEQAPAAPPEPSPPRPA